MSDDFIESDDPELAIDAETHRATYRGEPLTGLVSKTLPDGSMVELHGYDDGDRSGMWTGWYPDGGERYEGLFSRNHPIDEWREWHPDGTKAVEDIYDSDGRRLSHIRWDESGQQVERVDERTIKGIDADAIEQSAPEVTVDPASSTLRYAGRPYSGQVVTRLDAEDERSPITRVTRYLDGLPHGPEISWYPDGTTRSTGQFAEGRAVGTWLDRRPDGTPERRVEFSDAGKVVSVENLEK
ncbi:toxin-antitoxin system YwqK family antitoxin [Nocardia sp. MW-W600-9]